MSFGTTFNFTSPLDPPAASGKASYGYKWESSSQNSRGFPLGIDGLSPQSDAVVTHKEKRRPFPGSPIGEAPQHMLGLFLSPSEKSQAFLESLTLSPNSLRESNQNLTDQEEDDFHGFSLPPSAFSEHDEFLMGMGGMDDIDEFDSPSTPHVSVNHQSGANPVGRHHQSGNRNGENNNNIQQNTYSNVTRSRNRSLNGSPYGGILNSYSPSLTNGGGGGASGFTSSPGGSTLSGSFGIAPSHLNLHSSPMQSRGSGSYLFSPSLDSFGSPTVHDQIPAKRSNSLNPSTGSSGSQLSSNPLPSLEDLNAATLSPTQSSSSGEHPYGEHPSRTLFVRNINSNVEDQELRCLFEAYGPIRNMYTQCKHRGFVMISYYDIRHAKCAMKYLQSKLLRRRKLDIHYSIPKDNPTEKDQNQGTLVVFNLDPSISSDELRDIFGVHGEIKEIRETPNKKHHKFIEFYDVRDAEKAMKFLNKTEIKSKKIKIEPSRPGGRKSFSGHSPSGGDPPGSPDFSLLSEFNHSGANMNFSSPTSSNSHAQQQQQNPIRSPVPGGFSRDFDSGSTAEPQFNAIAPAWPRQSEWNWGDDSRQLSQSAPKDFSNSSNGNWPSAASVVSSAHSQIAATRSNSHGMHFPSHSHSLLYPPTTLNVSVSSRAHSDFSEQFSSPQSPFLHSVAPASPIGLIPPSSLNESPSLSPMMTMIQDHHHHPGSSSTEDLEFAWGKSVHGNHRALRSISLPIGHPDMSGLGLGLRDLTESPRTSHLAMDYEMDFSELHLGQNSSSSSSGLGMGMGMGLGSLSGLSLLPSGNGSHHGGPDSPGRSAGSSMHPLGGLLNSPRSYQTTTGSNSEGESLNSNSPIGMKPLGSAGAGFSSSSSSDVSPGGGGGGASKKTPTSGGRKGEGHSGGERNPYSLDLDAVQNGGERRTTLMIKNIPNKYTQKMLLATVDDTHQGLYDFFYLPIDFKNKCNVGYAFVNFIEPRSIISFSKKLHHSKWEKFNSEKVCEITFARIQGKDNLISHFQNSSLMSEDKRCRPMIFHSSGPNVGQPAPFPVGSNIRTRPKEEKNRRDPRARFYKEEYRSTQKKSGSQSRSRSLSYNN